eukprot:1228529-Amphidinium_carterae.1
MELGVEQIKAPNATKLHGPLLEFAPSHFENSICGRISYGQSMHNLLGSCARRASIAPSSHSRSTSQWSIHSSIIT